MKKQLLSKLSLSKLSKGQVKRILFCLFLFVLILGSFSLAWLDRTYGNISFEEIIFTINMPLQGAASEFKITYIKEALLPTIGIWILLIFLIYYRFLYGMTLEFSVLGNKIHFQLLPLRLPGYLITCIVIIWAGAMFHKADTSFKLYDYMVNQMQKSSFIEEEYVDPASVKLTFPEKKRNLVCIYLESMETSLMDYENGGLFRDNYIPELTQLAKDNVSFSHSDKLEGAVVGPSGAWTMAGLVGETAGVPLKTDNVNAYNTMGKYEKFLPGVVSLGELLADAGYKNYFMAGSNFGFGGRSSYFTKHGDYTVWDYNYAKAIDYIPKDYKAGWGMEDVKLFELAKIKLQELVEEGEPFNLSLLTVDTHNPSGYVCELCENNYQSQYGNVYACSSKRVTEFVEWIQEQDFYDNITICISGDHCSMNNGFFTNDTSDTIEAKTRRKVYNCFVNPAVDTQFENNREFLTLDMYPTVVASLGIEIEGNRLGLGTNLFSGEKTLSEQYGYTRIFSELSKKSTFYDKKLLY